LFAGLIHQIQIKSTYKMSDKLVSAEIDFLAMYNELTSIKKRGFKGGFIRPKIAVHCGVSVSTVSGWIAGKKISEPCAKLLQSFEVK